MEKIDKNINLVIDEMMGFSTESDKLAKDILKYLDDEIKAGNITRHPDDEEEGTGEIYTINNYVKDFTVNGKSNIYVLKIVIRNFSEDMDDKTMFDLAKEIASASCILSMDNQKRPAFIIDGSLVYRGWKLHKFIEGVFHHEIKHAYTHIKTLGDKDIEEWMDDEKNATPRKIYQAANELTENPIVKIFMPDIFEVAASVYITDKQEIASFTQQAYVALEDAKSFSDVDKIIKTTELYNYSKFLTELIDKLEDDESLYTKFIAVISPVLPSEVTMPTYNMFMKMLRKREKEYTSKVGKVIVYTKDRLRENAVREGYMIPLIIHDTNWKEVYKLGFY